MGHLGQAGRWDSGTLGQWDSGTAADARQRHALARAAEWCRLADEAEVAAVGAALAEWLSEPHGGRLDAALGLRNGRGKSWRTAALIEERDKWLREGAARFRLSAKRMVELMAYYESTGWQRECGLEECPERLKGSVREYLWHALRAWPRVVGERQMRSILEMKS